MFNKILFAGVFVLLCSSFVLADPVSSDAVEVKTADLMQTFKQYRSDVYGSLDLTPEQAKQINEVDVAFYAEMEPEMRKIAGMTQKLEDIANSENCTKEAVLAVKKDFKTVEKGMNVINKRYAKQYKSVLTRAQKSKYRKVRAEKRAEIKAEIIRQQELQKQQL